MLLWILCAWAEPQDASGWGDLAEAGETTVKGPKVHEAKLYGFIDSYWEMVAPVPDGVENGETLASPKPAAFSLSTTLFTSSSDNAARRILDRRSTAVSTSPFIPSSHWTISDSSYFWRFSYK